MFPVAVKCSSFPKYLKGKSAIAEVWHAHSDDTDHTHATGKMDEVTITATLLIVIIVI